MELVAELHTKIHCTKDVAAKAFDDVITIVSCVNHCIAAKEFNLRYDDDAQQLHVSQLFPEEGVLADVLPEYLSDWASELLQAKRKPLVSILSPLANVCAKALEAARSNPASHLLTCLSLHFADKMHLYRKEAIVKCDYDQESDKLVLELSGRDKVTTYSE